jgi:hypothetical protein
VLTRDGVPPPQGNRTCSPVDSWPTGIKLEGRGGPAAAQGAHDGSMRALGGSALKLKPLDPGEKNMPATPGLQGALPLTFEALTTLKRTPPSVPAAAGACCACMAWASSTAASVSTQQLSSSSVARLRLARPRARSLTPCGGAGAWGRCQGFRCGIQGRLAAQTPDCIGYMEYQGLVQAAPLWVLTNCVGTPQAAPHLQPQQVCGC